MRLTNSELNLQLELQENEVTVLILENPVVFSEAIVSLMRAQTGEETDFVLSDCQKILSFAKEMEMITDPFLLDLNNRKVLQRLYKEWSTEANELTEEKARINTLIVDVLNELQMRSFCGDVTFNLELSWEDIFKLYQVCFEKEYSSILEKLISYLKIVSGLLGIHVLVLVNVKTYLTKSELEQFYAMAFYCKVHLILLENREGERMEQEKVYIVDRDRCLIIK